MFAKPATFEPLMTNYYFFFRTEDCTNGSPNNKLAIIVHGWTEHCEKPWAKNLIGSKYA